MANHSDTQTESILESSLTYDDDALDPRVQVELERLNHANEAINHLELQLDDARKTLKEFCDTTEEELSQLEKSIGSAVKKAQSYYDARIKLRDAKEALTKAKHRFERAQALYVAAKELAVVSADYIDEAEKLNQSASTWNETYGQAIAKAADAEREKYQADLDQQQTEQMYFEIEKLVEKLQKDNRRAINKSQPYYEKKSEYYKELDFQKRKVYGLEICVNEAKTQYQESLHNLEKISNEIHEQRNRGKLRRELGERTAGVGEEQIDYTEFEQLPPSPIKTSPSTSPKISPLKRLNRSEQILRSCLLRTEILPAGIFANKSGRSSPEGDETTPTNCNDQFILNPKQSLPQPPSVVVIDSDKKTKKIFPYTHHRKLSDGYSSQVTDDEDDRTGSLHVLTDEQLEHLASVYHPLPPPPPPPSSQTGTAKTSSTRMSESLLYSLSNPLSKLVLRQ